jgi:hypothetical protein
MRRLVLLAAVAGLALSSCSHLTGRVAGDAPVRVLVTHDGQVAVGRDPIYATGPTTLVWRLPRLGDFTFARDGIVVHEAPEGEFLCRVSEDAKAFTCDDRHSRPGRYKYSVKILRNGQPLPPLDPYIINR